MNTRATTFGWRLTLGMICTLFAACTPAEDGASKGGEDDPLTSGDLGKTDSFRAPTEHGEIFPGESGRVKVEDGKVYHAWTFTLTAPADLTLSTSVSTNLDTVMYVYRREPGASAWGSYVAKNDDYRGNIWSRVDIDKAEAGEYRVIVKPFKSALRGEFTFEYGCTGAGCQQRTDLSMCAAEPYLSASSTITSACLETFQGILDAPVQPTASVPDCVLERAADQYDGYWGSLTGDRFERDDLEISGRVHGDRGFVVDVSAGGDEDTLYYVFDAQGRIVMYAHSEQSPSMEWSCAEDGDMALDPRDTPDEECALGMIHALGYSAEQLMSHGEFAMDGDTTDVPELAIAVAQYGIDTYGVRESEEVHYEIYDLYDAKELTARVVLGDPMEEGAILLFARQSYGGVEILSYSGDVETLGVCQEIK